MIPTQPAVALSFLCLLLDVLRNLFNADVTNQSTILKPRYFYDGTFKYSHMDRLGGNLSYLRNVYKKELCEALGEQEEDNHLALTDELQDAENQSDMSICKYE